MAILGATASAMSLMLAVPVIGLMAIMMGGEDVRLDLGEDTLTMFDYEWAQDPESLKEELADLQDTGQPPPREVAPPDKVTAAGTTLESLKGIGQRLQGVDLGEAGDAVARDRINSKEGGTRKSSTADATLDDADFEAEGLGSLDGLMQMGNTDAFADARREKERATMRQQRNSKRSPTALISESGMFDKLAGHCATKSRTAGDIIGGEFSATYTLGTDGRVRDVTLTGVDGSNPRLEKCITSAMNGHNTGAKGLSEPLQGEYLFFF